MEKIKSFVKEYKALVAVIVGAALLVGVILLVSAQCIDTVNYNEADFILDGTRHTVKITHWEYEDGERTIKVRADDGMVYYIPQEQCILSYYNYIENAVSIVENDGKEHKVASLKTSFDGLGFYYQSCQDIDTKNWGRQKRVKITDGHYVLIPQDLVEETMSQKKYDKTVFESEKTSIRDKYKGVDIFFSTESGFNSAGV